MSVDNQTVLVGNLAADPDLRYTPQGIPVASVRLAVNERVLTDKGWENGDTSFFNVVVWRDLAVHTAESLHRGDRAIVAGRWRSRAYETPKGEKRSVTELHADEVGPSLRWVTCPQLIKGRDRDMAAEPEPAARREQGAGQEPVRTAARGIAL
jgi:single-strand DNA-binding protein